MFPDDSYIADSTLQDILLDKESGEPLASGQIFFYSDISRTVLKNVFTISGSPPNYSFVPLENPVNLGPAGNPVDNSGNDVKIYYFPYDAQGNIELYFVSVFNQGGIPQFTREAWPPDVPQGTGTENTSNDNFIPNGQFWQHDNVPATSTTDVGEITTPVTDIATGGWTFERDAGSTSTDFVTFDRFAQDITVPTANPRFAVHVKRTAVAGTNTFCDIRITFRNVNQFASPTDIYTFGFNGIDNGLGGTPVTLFTINNFGTGTNSPTASLLTQIKTFNLTTAYGAMLFVSLNFPNNPAAIIGNNDDDVLQLVMRMPLTGAFDVSMTDFCLVFGEVTLINYPVITINQDVSDANLGNLPILNPNGNDLYLPIMQGRLGFLYDRSRLGKVFAATTTTLNIGELALDGSQFLASNASSDGIPYSRLQKIWFNGSTGLPQYGTGHTFVTAYISGLVAGALNQIRLSSNILGIATNPADSSPPTTFTFATPVPGVVTPAYNVTGYSAGANTILVLGNVVGVQFAAPDPGTSTFTVQNYLYSSTMLPYGNSSNYQVFTVGTVAGSALAAPAAPALYWLFSDTVKSYYMWFKFTTETDPAIAGHTSIEVNLTSSGLNYTAAEIAGIVKEVLGGYQINTIVTKAANTITGGATFTFSSPSTNYYVYYIVNGVGVDPEIAGKVPIAVILTGTETDVQVATKTQAAINSTYLSLPNFQGLFPRGYDPNSIWDLDSGSRFSSTAGLFGNNLGTYEYYLIQSHFHQYNTKGGAVNAQVGTDDALSNISTFTSATGGTETRPINFNVVWVTYY